MTVIKQRQPDGTDIILSGVGPGLPKYNGDPGGGVITSGMLWADSSVSSGLPAFGIVTGTIADGGSLTQETIRATGVELTKRNRFNTIATTKTASYTAAVWDSATYDTTSGAISQALPSSPTVGDEFEAFLTAGTNTFTITGPGGPFSISVAGHGTVFRWNGSAWVERQDRKTLASMDGRYVKMALAPSGDTTGATDSTRLTSQLASLSGGGKLILQAGTYYINAPLVIPHQVFMVGQGRTVTTVKAGSAFSGANVITIGAVGAGSTFSCGPTDMTIDANRTVNIGVYSTTVNEQAGIRDCLVRGYLTKGAFFDCRVGSDHADDMMIRDCEFWGANTVTTSVAIHVNDAASKINIDNVTLNVDNGATKQATGIWLTASDSSHFCFGMLRAIHSENHSTAVLFDANTMGTLDGLSGYCYSSGDTVLSLNTANPVKATALLKSAIGGVGYIVNDSVSGYKSAAPTLGEYGGAAPTIGYKSSAWWYGPAVGTISTVSAASGRLSVVPLVLNKPGTFGAIGVHVSIAGGSGSTARLGIYADDGAGYPGDLLLDAGTVATDTTGDKTITITKYLPTGLYWLAYEDVQVTSAPTLFAVGTAAPMIVNGHSLTSGIGAPMNGFFDNSHTGTLPTTWPGITSGVWSNAPFVALRPA